MQRLGVVGHGGEEEIVGLRHRAADFMVDPVADGPFVIIAARHQSSPRSTSTSSVPSLTCPPSVASSSATTPSKGAVRPCSIFIASSEIGRASCRERVCQYV